MQARILNEYGKIDISTEVFANLVGFAASGCYGVVGMANKSKTDGIVRLLKRDLMDKGVKVTIEEDGVDIDLHIVVEYGINICAISQSIISRVKYFIENTTGFVVKAVNVYVDSIRIDE